MMVMVWVYRYFSGSTQSPPIKTVDGVDVPYHHPKWSPGTEFSLYIFTSPHYTLSPSSPLSPLVNFTNLHYNFDDSNSKSLSLHLLASNSTLSGSPLFAHIYAVRSGSSLNTSAPTTNKNQLKGIANLTVSLPPPKLKSSVNLITGESEHTEEEIEAYNAALPKLISYWKPCLSLSLVYDVQTYASGSIPPPLSEAMVFDRLGEYYPILYVNDFWHFHEDNFPINDTTPTLPLNVTYDTLSQWKFVMYRQMDQSLNFQESMGSSASDSDEFKRMLRDTNVYLLALTMVVTLLHTIFDVLAFKNDISFWREQKSMEGLSIKSIFVNLASQIIILLYLADNDTSFLILVSTFVGCCIEGWKITKATDVEYQWPKGGFPRIRFKDKSTYVASETKEYDEMAWKYLSWVLFPLVMGYSIYTLFTSHHKSWYSWILSSLVGSIYTFGFIMMCPQLFINYKLKSVAHLPWRTFTYKALNTFIDDLFAFIIRMPTMHRLACFRDDLVFFILLYQRWIYPVDMKRRNEYGQKGEAGDEDKKDQ